MKPAIYRNHVILPDDNRIRVMIPHAKPFQADGQSCLLVPHNVDETQLLRNLGYEVRPPVMETYDWPAPPGQEPFEAQRVTTALITTHRRSYVFNGIGTGKTRSVLFAYDYLKKTNPNMGRLVVTAPLSTLRQVWAREMEMVFPWLKYRVLHASKAKRIAMLDDDADVFIINHDGVETILGELVARKDLFDMAALDELSVYKNANTDMWKCTYRFMSEIDRVTGLTATPIPLAATDAYGQIKMLIPATLKGKSFSRFREEVQTKVGHYRWVNKRNAIDTVFAMMQPQVRFTRDECYDLPPCQIVNYEAELTTRQFQLFKAMGDHSAIPAHNIIAANAADKGNKCLQIALGVLYDQDHNIIDLDPKPRLKVLDEAIEQSQSKVIIFTPYKHSLAQLVKHVSQRWTCQYVSGDVNPAQRERVFTLFRHSPDPHVLIAHPECMSHGLTLTEASTIVWWGPPQSLETYEQANGRITRAGQKHSQLIINITATKLEQAIFKLLERRANVQEALLAMFESQDFGDLS